MCHFAPIKPPRTWILWKLCSAPVKEDGYQPSPGTANTGGVTQHFRATVARKGDQSLPGRCLRRSRSPAHPSESVGYLSLARAVGSGTDAGGCAPGASAKVTEARLVTPLYERATATCQDFTKADLLLWLAHSEAPEEQGPARLEAGALCQFVIDTEGMDRKGRRR